MGCTVVKKLIKKMFEINCSCFNQWWKYTILVRVIQTNFDASLDYTDSSCLSFHLFSVPLLSRTSPHKLTACIGSNVKATETFKFVRIPSFSSNISHTEEIHCNNKESSYSINRVGITFCMEIKSLLGYDAVLQSIKGMHQVGTGCTQAGWQGNYAHVHCFVTQT